MKSNRNRLALVGLLALALTVGSGMVSAGPAGAKKKKSGGTATVTKSVNAAVPDRNPVAPGIFGRLDVTLPVGGKFKGKVVSADGPSVTFQASGTVGNAADDLEFYLSSPKGRTLRLLPNRGTLGGTSIGPLTLTTNSSVGTCNTVAPPCVDPFLTLLRPFVGTAGDAQLARFRGESMKGNWKFTVFDDAVTKTSVLNSVTLKVPAAK